MARWSSFVACATAALFSSVSALSSNPTCPESNGIEYTAISGAVYRIECGIDRKGIDIKYVQVYSNKIADCIAHCDATSECVDITMSGTACYLKSQAGQTISTTSFTSTFSIPTSTAAVSTASVPTVDSGLEVISYSTVEGYFLQDLNSTNASTFDYTATNFGLINQTYPTDSSSDAALTQWQRFNRVLLNLNKQAASNVAYKLLFIGRHGEGYHNAAQTYYGTPAWNCYWSELDGNGTSSWADADLTSAGIAQAQAANSFWATSLETQKITPPQSFYVSPLTRCLKTANLTYASLSLSTFIPTIKEFFRESISTHTCDHRSNKTYIHSLFPAWKIESTLTEEDEVWNGVTAETSSSQDYRSKIVLDDVFSSDSAEVVSITTHSGEAGSLLRVLGHRTFSLVTGAIIPVLVKAETVKVDDSTSSVTSTSPWTASSWCTNGPPLTSASAGCVCSNGVTPVATVLASVTAGF